MSVSTLDPDLSVDEMRRHLTQWFGADVAGWQDIARYDIPAALPVADPPLGKLRQPVRLSPGLYVCGDHRDSPSPHRRSSSHHPVSRGRQLSCQNRPQPQSSSWRPRCRGFRISR
jgi:hypothetical protein